MPFYLESENEKPLFPTSKFTEGGGLKELNEGKFLSSQRDKDDH